MSSKRFLLVGAAIGLSLGLVYYPTTKYTMTHVPPAPTTPALFNTLPPRMGTYNTLSTRIDRSVPLDEYLQAFYSTWTLKVEGLVFTKFGDSGPELPLSAKPSGILHCQGLFPEIYRDDNAAMVWWKAGEAAGGQIFTVAPKDGGTEISYSCTEVDEDQWLMTFLNPFHLFYMRYLFHAAVKALEKGRQ